MDIWTNEEIYMELPLQFMKIQFVGFENQLSIEESPKHWYERFHIHLLKQGYQKCANDTIVYINQVNNNKFVSIRIIHG
jgi:hypothetical protein